LSFNIIHNGVASVKWKDSTGEIHIIPEKQYMMNFQADHEERIDEVEKLESNEDEETKVQEIAANEKLIEQKEDELKKKERAAITSLSAQEKDDLLDELRAELSELTQEKEDREKKESKEASLDRIFVQDASMVKDSSLELIGVESLEPTYRSNILDPDHSYNVLSYIPHTSTDKSGDALFLELGSSD